MATEKGELVRVTPYRAGISDLDQLRANFRTSVEDIRTKLARLYNIPTVLLLASMISGEYNWGSEHNIWKFAFHAWHILTIAFFQKALRNREKKLSQLLRYETNIVLDEATDKSAQIGFSAETNLSPQPLEESDEKFSQIAVIPASLLLLISPITLQLFVQAAFPDIENVKYWHWMLGEVATGCVFGWSVRSEEATKEFRDTMAALAAHIGPHQEIRDQVTAPDQAVELPSAAPKVTAAASPVTLIRIADTSTPVIRKDDTALADADELTRALGLRRVGG
jgi:hypothetical protein